MSVNFQLEYSNFSSALVYNPKLFVLIYKYFHSLVTVLIFFCFFLLFSIDLIFTDFFFLTQSIRFLFFNLICSLE